MCGRYSLAVEAEDIARLFNVPPVERLQPRYNIAPTQPVLVIREHPDRTQREAAHVVWGLIPSWAKDPSVGARLINARAETVMEKPSFRNAFKRRRCLVPTTGFYEWQRRGKAKVPYFIRAIDTAVFAFAGLWEHWSGPNGEELESCTILTTTPNALTSQVHNRMPVILSEADYNLWLDRSVQTPEQLQPLLQSYPAEHMQAFEVSTLVNNPQNDDKRCMEPVG
jgi:putative SOS response-associated peptidase YedK